VSPGKFINLLRREFVCDLLLWSCQCQVELDSGNQPLPLAFNRTYGCSL